MNAKEKRAFRKLELENEELKRHFKISCQSSSDNFLALYDARLAIRIAYEALQEAAKALENNMRDNPDFKDIMSREATS